MKSVESDFVVIFNPFNSMPLTSNSNNLSDTLDEERVGGMFVLIRINDSDEWRRIDE